MHKIFLKTAGILAALSVALGAFGAHTLKEANINAATISIFDTAVRYQFYHVFALLITGMLYKDFPFKITLLAGQFFITGILLFSGSLYLLTWLKATGITGYDAIGAVTPLGGLAFIAGWICLVISFFKK